MASATDIITYIGVPLAVLGVTPIFYTFLSALYTRLKLERTLRRNGLVCSIRPKLMTGTVDVDLPVYYLTNPFRDSPVYWLPSRLKIGIDGVSWSCYNFHTAIVQRSTSRLQRSDKVVFPAAEIIFKSLLEYLLDLGYSLDQEGFRTLRTRREQTSEGTVLIYIEPGRSLRFAGPGNRHGSITLSFSDPPRSAPFLQLKYRDPTQDLPPFHLTGVLLETQREAPPAIDNRSATIERPNVSTDADDTVSTEENRRYFVMKYTATVGLEIFIHESPAPSMGTELPRDHILSHLHPDNDNLAPGTAWGQPLNWFACAAIAVYGFDLRPTKSFYIFPPNKKFLHGVQWLDLDLSVVTLYGLVESDTEDQNEFLRFVDVDPYDPASVIRSEDPQQDQAMDASAKRWMARRDLKYVSKVLPRKSCLQLEFEFDHEKALKALFHRRIDMPNLSRLCIRSLLSHPIRLKSLLVGGLPEQPSGLDHITQHIADQILRMMILDSELAKGIRAQIHQLLKSPLAGALEAVQASRKHKKSGKYEALLNVLQMEHRCSQKDTGRFCCAVILLAVIRQRADFLRSGDDIRQCVNDWPTVYLS